MATDVDVIARWEQRRREWARHRAQVDGVTVCDDVLADLRALQSGRDERLLNLTDAARLSGYSREHLGRLVQSGKLHNAGRPNAPRVRLSHLPLKPGHLPPERVPGQLSGTSKRQIVRSIVGTTRSSR